MFNDTLTNEQCERLVQQLSCTAFPFQCAHGRFVPIVCPRDLYILTLGCDRPSLVPLTNVATFSPGARRSNGARVVWSRLEC